MLRIICRNKIANLHRSEKEKRIIVLMIDESEPFFYYRGKVVDINLLNNFARKFDCSFTFILHRAEDLPEEIKNNPNLNCFILKGYDSNLNEINTTIEIDGEEKTDIKKLNRIRKRAKFYFRPINTEININGIPECEYYDFEEYSHFVIQDVNHIEKSVNLDKILEISMNNKSYVAPRKIIEYLEKDWVYARYKIEDIRCPDYNEDVFAEWGISRCGAIKDSKILNYSCNILLSNYKCPRKKSMKKLLYESLTGRKITSPYKICGKEEIILEKILMELSKEKKDTKKIKELIDNLGIFYYGNEKIIKLSETLEIKQEK